MFRVNDFDNNINTFNIEIWFVLFLIINNISYCFSIFISFSKKENYPSIYSILQKLPILLFYFETFLKEGKDILHVTLSSGISGSINSAMIAKSMLEEKYPERKIYIVDSLLASSGYGLLMDKLADLRDAGKTMDEVYTWAEENKLKAHAWFFSTDLTFFVKGGRVSKTSGFVGGILNICPLLNMDREGKLIPRHKIRTKKKVIEAMVEQMEQFAQDGFDYNEKCYISHSACMEDAKAVAEKIESRFPKLKGKVEINDIGTTIGSHTGPGTVALFFWGEGRE